jgi:hypothetical protein
MLAVAAVALGGAGGCVSHDERIATSQPALTGRQLYVAPGGDDAGRCSRRTPCRRLERADALATPGTTVNVAPGTYEPATLKASGTPSARIRFVSTRRWKATIRDTDRSPGAILRIAGRRVDVVGFEVTSAEPADVDGITISGSHSRAIGNIVHDLDRPCGPSGGIVAADDDYAARGMAIIGNVVRDIGRGPRDGSCSLLHGIYAAVPGVIIANNLVVRALGDGITSWHAATRLTIVNNTLVANGQDGILLGNGDDGGTAKGNTGSYVANNLIVANAGDAISEGGARPVHNRLVRNTFHDNGRDLFDQWGSSTETGTQTRDPAFADPAGDDYRPRAGSPALGSGTVWRAPTTDILGIVRGRSVTRGAYQEPA